jgi:hypothetical protein
MSLSFLVVGPRDFEPDGLPQQFFERRDVPVRGPELELGIPGRPQPCKVIVFARVEIDSLERSRVTAVETFREPDHRRQRLHRPARGAGEIAVAFVRLFGRRLPMVPCNESNHFDLERLESA